MVKSNNVCYKSFSIRPVFDPVDFDAGVVLLPTDDDHRLVGQVLLVVVDEPGRTFGNEIKSESERKEKEAGGQSEPVPF